MNLANPLDIKDGQLVRVSDLKASIDQTIELLLHTPVGSVAAEPEFGFGLMGLMFENFDEAHGTVYDDSRLSTLDSRLYRLKLSGSSRNLQTFAAELSKAITTYEPRLRDVTAVMTYMRQSRSIVVAVRGVMVRKKVPYEYRTIIKVWR